MRIITRYDPADATLLRVWERSWRLRGWKPAIITPKEIIRHKRISLAVRARGGSLFCTPRVINFSYSRPRKTPVKITFKRYGSRGWETAPVVKFPDDFSEAQILNCGRRI